MSATPAKVKGPRCTVCSRIFRTKAGFVQHSLSTGHSADRCCGPCSRIFGTKEGLEAHQNSSVHTKSPSTVLSNRTPKKNAPATPPTITKQPKCTACSRSFQTKAQLAQHSLDSAHGDDRCCQQCIRLFSTKEALEAHKESSVCKRVARKNTKVSTAKPLQQSQFPISPICRGNSYRQIPQTDRIDVLQKLVSRCHPRSTLQRHGYSVSEAAGRDRYQTGSCGLGQATDSEDLPLPQDDPSRNTRKAVALDCEMVGVEGGASELVSLTAVDFLTGELIVNSLVKPQQPVVDWRTQIHGISPAGLSVARAHGLVLDGWPAARAELFKHVDRDTVLIGHSLQYDLAALHARHDRVVDSAVLASEAVFRRTGKPRYWGLGLKDVCSELLGLKIREEAPLGVSKVHDGLEDVLAAREVVLCCLEQPTAFKAWARRKRNSFWRVPPRKVPRGKNQTHKKQKYQRSNDREDDDEEYMSDEILRWEDVIDYETWPKSPPDSD